jgi:hypothetical protein
MPLGFIRCPECGAFGRRRLVPPRRNSFDGTPAPVFEQERICTSCGAWLWVVGRDVMPAAPRLFTMSVVAGDDDELDAVLAGIAATECFRREFQAASSAAWPSATVKRFS